MHGLNQATRRKARRTLALRDAAKSLRQVVEREQRILRDLQEAGDRGGRSRFRRPTPTPHQAVTDPIRRPQVKALGRKRAPVT